MKSSKQYKIYNNDEFVSILKNEKNISYKITLERFKEYLDKYPYDNIVLIHYANFLMLIGELEEAKIILDNIVPIKGSIDCNKNYMIAKMKLLCCQKNFSEAYELIMDNLQLFENYRNIEDVILFLRKKLELPITYKYSKSYIYNQIRNYSEDLALEHIYEQHILSRKSKSTFNCSFPLQECYKKILKELYADNYKILFNNVVSNFIVFKSDFCGIYEGKKMDFIKTVLLHDSKNIITMYPFDNKIELPYIDITEEELNDEVKIKRFSQIEKFNRKYNK